MKLKIFASVCCLIMGLSLSAQTTKSTENKSPKDFPNERMIKELNLSQKQIDELKSFREQQIKERDEYREARKKQTPEQKGDSAEKRVSLEKRKDDNRAKMKQILTPEQYTKFLEMNLDQRQRMDKKSKHSRQHKNASCCKK
ncbi:MAG: Spy/CpxP family protein refolding chaperone [Bacteroidales bacterium]